MEVNIRKGKKRIVSNCTLCTSLFSKAKGLMFSKKKNLLFVFEKEKRISLHMLFVFFPIRAIGLNERKKVISIKKLFPFISLYYTKEKAKYIIETTENPMIKRGEKVSW